MSTVHCVGTHLEAATYEPRGHPLPWQLQLLSNALINNVLVWILAGCLPAVSFLARENTSNDDSGGFSVIEEA